MPDLTSDDYAALAKSYEVEPPRRDELVGEPVLNPRREPPDERGHGIRS